MRSRATVLATAIAFVASAAVSLHAQQSVTHPASWQIAAAVTPLPDNQKAGATVLGYDANGKLVQLRAGQNDMICLAPDPHRKSFHSACYHRAMEAFMARGRALRAEGVKDDQVDTVRFAEVKSGKLKVPTQPTMLYQIFGGTFDEATGTVAGGQRLYVTYIPFATEKSTGISTVPSDKAPWLMFPGTPKAHIMFSTSM